MVLLNAARPAAKMRPSRGMGAIAPSKMPKARNIIKRDGNEPVKVFKKGGKVKKFGLGGVIDPVGTYVMPKSVSQNQYYDPVGNQAGIDNQYNINQQKIKDQQQAMLDQQKMEEQAQQQKINVIRQSIAATNTANTANTANYGMKKGGKVNEAGNYTKPGLRKRIFNSIKAAAVQGTGAGQWSARKAQLMAKRYKAAGGGYRD
jgi:hypothetical protein